jgi:peptidyl-prolyl cis-trans isomerase B (cyclophilin B)
MFRQNREFWLYFLGVILLFFFIFGILENGFTQSSFTFSSFPFNLFKQEPLVVVEETVPQLDQSKDYYAILSTGEGKITVDLFETNAPNTVANFIHLANKNYYYNLEFHRYLPGLLLQGGSRNTKNKDPNDDAFGGPGYTIPDEINWDSLDYPENFRAILQGQGYTSTPNVESKKMGKFSVAMAGNGPNTAGSQFFIVLAENTDPRLAQLEGRHTVFGHVIGGFETINAINARPAISLGINDSRPLNLVLYSVQIEYKD